MTLLDLYARPLPLRWRRAPVLLWAGQCAAALWRRWIARQRQQRTLRKVLQDRRMARDIGLEDCAVDQDMEALQRQMMVWRW
ncbi:MAG: hypothetical protein AAF713_17440 [Pseudomonadota bacterium]